MEWTPGVLNICPPNSICFSPKHTKYTQELTVLIDQKLLSKVVQVHYHNIAISDHFPVALELSFQDMSPNFSWRINPRLFSELSFVDFINTKIYILIELNRSPEISNATLCKNPKAYTVSEVRLYSMLPVKIKGQNRPQSLLNKFKLYFSYIQKQFRLFLQNKDLTSDRI